MKRHYMAFCKCGGLVALAAAHTISDIADNAKNAKSWVKAGFKVDLVESKEGDPMPEWCQNDKAGSCI